MTSEERRHLMAQLADGGLWSSDEPGDPTKDEDAARELERRITDRAGVRFMGFGMAGAGTDATSMNNIAVYHGDDILLRVTGNTNAEAICYAAVALTALVKKGND